MYVTSMFPGEWPYNTKLKQSTLSLIVLLTIKKTDSPATAADFYLFSPV